MATTAAVALTVTVTPGLTVSFSPANPSISQAATPGTVVTTITTIGGTGGPVTLALGPGSSPDFVLSGNSIVVGPGGIPISHIGPPAQVVHVVATQA